MSWFNRKKKNKEQGFVVLGVDLESKTDKKGYVPSGYALELQEKTVVAKDRRTRETLDYIREKLEEVSEDGGMTAEIEEDVHIVLNDEVIEELQSQGLDVTIRIKSHPAWGIRRVATIKWF